MASMAKVCAAMDEILCAMASCLPTGLPHCTRSDAHLRQISRHSLAVPTEPFGMESRPSLIVVSAILRPRPSCPMSFSTGTTTSLKLMTPLARARSPMKCERCSTFTPAQAVSTTKALILRVLGSTAITTSSFAIVPFVHQSLVPLRTYASPSGVFSAVGGSPAGAGAAPGPGPPPRSPPPPQPEGTHPEPHPTQHYHF